MCKTYSVSPSKTMGFCRLPSCCRHFVAYWPHGSLLHLIVKETEDSNAGRYRQGNVLITGSSHKPPDAFKIPKLMKDLLTMNIYYEDFCPISPLNTMIVESGIFPNWKTHLISALCALRLLVNRTHIL
ncbi:MAG: hypothetical protein J0M15_14075 [Deltaproteobacteria bacterium]|nr:hypothetical protein [Deltaproteobacteria bacterium]